MTQIARSNESALKPANVSAIQVGQSRTIQPTGRSRRVTWIQNGIREARVRMSDMGKVFLMTDPPFNQLFTHSLRSGSDCFSKRRDFIQQPSVLGQIGHAKREFTGLAGSNDVTWSS